MYLPIPYIFFSFSTFGENPSRKKRNKKNKKNLAATYNWHSETSAVINEFSQVRVFLSYWHVLLG